MKETLRGLLRNQTLFWDLENKIIHMYWCKAVLPSHQSRITSQSPFITQYYSKWTMRKKWLREDLHAAFYNLAASCWQLTPLFSTIGGAKDASSSCQGLTHDQGQKILPTSPHSELQLRSQSQKALVTWSSNRKRVQIICQLSLEKDLFYKPGISREDEKIINAPQGVEVTFNNNLNWTVTFPCCEWSRFC